MTDQSTNYSLLHAVASNSQFRVHEVRELIDAGAVVDITDSEGKTALLYAVLNDKESVVRTLIDNGADVNKTYKDGKTVLFYAVENDSLNVVRALFEKGKLSINPRDDYGRKPLYYAMTKSKKLVKYLLKKELESLHITNYNHCIESILSYFIENCTFNTPLNSLQNIIEKGLKLFMRYKVKRKTILKTIMNVVYCKSLQITAKSDFNRICEVLEISKNYIKEKNRVKSVIDEVLVLLRQEMNRNDTSLCVAPEVLDLLLRRLNVDPNTADSNGNTVLHYATLLPFLGVSQEMISNIFEKLEIVKISKNSNGETPLLFCLSGDAWEMASTNNHWLGFKIIVNVVCPFLLTIGSDLTETIQRTGQSILHVVLELLRRRLCLSDIEIQKEVAKAALQLLQLFLSKEKNVQSLRRVVNIQDSNQNSPLHHWAKLALNSAHDQHLQTKTIEDLEFEKDIFEKILNLFLAKQAQINVRNENEETPLHLCQSWFAFQLLLKNGANPNDSDRFKRSPLIVAAMNKAFLRRESYFYPDVLQDPKEFWNNVLDHKLNPWAVDKDGKSVFSIFIDCEEFVLARPLLEVAIEKDKLYDDVIAENFLNAICHNKSMNDQKIDLLKLILKIRNTKRISVDKQLYMCCTNIIECYTNRSDDCNPTPAKKAKIEDSNENKTAINSIVHWKIAKTLYHYGANVDQSCLEIAKKCPPLEELLLARRDDKKLVIKSWKSHSCPLKHKPKLENVARALECKFIDHDKFWYHQDPLNSLNKGTFGNAIFAGIEVKSGREVAIKRVKLRVQWEEEIKKLTALSDCKQVVSYFSPFEDTNLFYIVLELMEGNLKEWLYLHTLDIETIQLLCRDLLAGLKFIHLKKVLHCKINPKSIFYKKHPNLCFKFGNFGYDESSSSDVTMTYWNDPEQFVKGIIDHSEQSDMFSFGRVLIYCLYIFSEKGDAVDHTNRVVDPNDIDDDVCKWKKQPCPEAVDLLKILLERNQDSPPTAAKAMSHPWLWTKKKKMDFLFLVGNQPEFTCPHDLKVRNGYPFSKFEKDLEKRFSAIVKYNKWDDLSNNCINYIKGHMERQNYNTSKATELLRFIRNVVVHPYDLPDRMKKWVLEDYVFLECFPNLVMEVLQVVNLNGWNLKKEFKGVLD